MASEEGPVWDEELEMPPRSGELSEGDLVWCGKERFELGRGRDVWVTILY